MLVRVETGETPERAAGAKKRTSVRRAIGAACIEGVSQGHDRVSMLRSRFNRGAGFLGQGADGLAEGVQLEGF